MPTIHLRTGTEADRPAGGVSHAPTGPLRRSPLQTGILVAVTLGGLLIVFLVFGVTQGWFSHPDYAPANAPKAEMGASPFSEDHPLGQKRNSSLTAGGSGEQQK